MFLIIFLCVVGACALIGLITGLVKGVSRTKTWANDLWLTALVVIPVTRLFLNIEDEIVRPVAVLGMTLGALLLFTLISALVKKFLSKHWKPFGRICGGITLAVKGATIVLLIAVPILIVLEALNVEAVNSLCSSLFEWTLWVNVKPYVADYYIIAFMLFLLREGYKTGVSGAIWSVVKIALFCGAAYLAYYLAFNIEVFVTAGENFAANASFFQTIGDYTVGMSETLTAAFWAKCVITAGLCVALWIVTGILCFIISRLLDRLRDGKVFSVVDGALGAIIMFAVFMAVLMVLGTVLNTVSEVEFMSTFNTYVQNGGIASLFYDESPLKSIEFFANLDIAKWFE